MVGSAHRNSGPHVRTFFETEKGDLGLCIRSDFESDCVALEQYLCGFTSMGNFGTRAFTLLSSARTCVALGDNRLSTDFSIDGRDKE